MSGNQMAERTSLVEYLDNRRTRETLALVARFRSKSIADQTCETATGPDEQHTRLPEGDLATGVPLETEELPYPLLETSGGSRERQVFGVSTNEFFHALK